MTGVSILGSVAAAATTHVHDTFGDRNGTALEDHVPDLAPGRWTVELGSWVIKRGFVSEESKARETPSSDYRAVIDSGAADGRVEATITNAGGSQFFGVVARYEGPIDWIMAFYDGQGDIVLGMKQPDEGEHGETPAAGGTAGYFQEFGRVSHEWKPGKTGRLAIVLSGPQFSVELDGELLIGPVSDDDNAGNSTHGIFVRGNGAARFDEFVVTGE